MSLDALLASAAADAIVSVDQRSGRPGIMLGRVEESRLPHLSRSVRIEQKRRLSGVQWEHQQRTLL